MDPNLAEYFSTYIFVAHFISHIYVDKLTIISSDNGLLPGRRQDIIRTNNGRLLIGPWQQTSVKFFYYYYFQTSTVVALTFVNGWVISYHTLLDM